MLEQETLPGEPMMVANVLTGVIVGLISSVLLCISILSGYNLSYWLVFPVYIVSGVAATLVVSFLYFLGKPANSSGDQSSFSRTSNIIAQRGRGSFSVDDDTRFDLPMSDDPFDNKIQTDDCSAVDFIISEKPATGGAHSSKARTAARPRMQSVSSLVNSDRSISPTRWQYTEDQHRTGRWSASPCFVARFFSEKINTEGAPMRPLSEGLIDRLFGRVVDLRPETEFGRDGIIGYFGEPTSGSLDEITRWAGPQRGLVFASSTDEMRWPEVLAVAQLAQVCFIDADYMGDLEATIDFCVRLRNGARQTPLVLISSEVRGHDLTAERCAICDATLMPPLSERIIQTGVSAAQENFSRYSLASFSSSRYER